MTIHHNLQSLYEKAERAMGETSSAVMLTLMRRQGNQVIMQEYESVPKEGFSEADAALLHIDTIDLFDSVTLFLVPGNPERMMLAVAGGTENSGTPTDRLLTPLEEQWLEVYLRLKAVAKVRPRADAQNRFAMVSWDPPRPPARANIRRRLGL